MCAYMMHTLAAGDPVKLTAHFAEVADAGDGPLKPGEIGRVVQVYQWRRGASFDVRACDGSVWWYKEGTIEFARRTGPSAAAWYKEWYKEGAFGCSLAQSLPPRSASPAALREIDASCHAMGLSRSSFARQTRLPTSVATKLAIDVTVSKTGFASFAHSAPGDSDDTASSPDDAKSAYASRRSIFSDSSDTSDSDSDMPKTLGRIIVDLTPSSVFVEEEKPGFGRRLSNLEGDDHFVLDLTDFASSRA